MKNKNYKKSFILQVKSLILSILMFLIIIFGGLYISNSIKLESFKKSMFEEYKIIYNDETLEALILLSENYKPIFDCLSFKKAQKLKNALEIVKSYPEINYIPFNGTTYYSLKEVEEDILKRVDKKINEENLKREYKKAKELASKKK